MAKDFYEMVDIIRTNLSEAAQLEQMAEECNELAQALLKKARKLRGENYTPKTLEEIQQSVEEEWADVVLCAEVLNLDFVPMNIMEWKLNRWVNRTSPTREQ